MSSKQCNGQVACQKCQGDVPAGALRTLVRLLVIKQRIEECQETEVPTEIALGIANQNVKR